MLVDLQLFDARRLERLLLLSMPDLESEDFVLPRRELVDHGVMASVVGDDTLEKEVANELLRLIAVWSASSSRSEM